jgi:thiazole synthase ThiGH ThiG subunit
MASVLTIAGEIFGSALMLGTAGYPNRQVMLDALAASGAEIHDRRFAPFNGHGRSLAGLT